MFTFISHTYCTIQGLRSHTFGINKAIQCFHMIIYTNDTLSNYLHQPLLHQCCTKQICNNTTESLAHFAVDRLELRGLLLLLIHEAWHHKFLATVQTKLVEHPCSERIGKHGLQAMPFSFLQIRFKNCTKAHINNCQQQPQGAPTAAA